MKKNDFIKIISNLRKNIQSPLFYANCFLDYNYNNKIYEDYFKKISLISYLKLISLLFINIILLIGIIIFKSKKNNNNFNLKKNKIVIIGHRIDSALNEDFYFFEIIKYFKSKSINFSLFQINHINSNLKSPNLINNYMKFKDELFLFFNITFSITKSVKQLNRIRAIKHNKFYFSLAFITFFLSNRTFNNLRIPLQINNIFKNSKKNYKIFITYEGYHWEKVLFGMIKKSNSTRKINNKLFAVQHSFIPSNNKNFFDFYNSDFNCDYLLLSGSILYKKVIKNFPYTINIGATKKNQIKKFTKSKNEKFILFLPSSNQKELEYLLDLLFKIHKFYPNYKFIWRSHPFMSSKLDNLFREYPQIEFSKKNDLNYDLSRSKIALYSISSSIIKAVSYGVRPVYVKNPDFDIDPLEDLRNSWKVKINNYKNINNFFNYDKNKQILKDMVISSLYCRGYFENFKKRKIISLLDEQL